VQRHEDDPFALIGVNTDRSKEQYRTKAQEMSVTWRSAWQGSTSGPITSLYQVGSYPTIHVIDAEGRLRYKNVRGHALERAVAALLEEMRADENP